MPSPATASLVDDLRKTRLLDATQCDEVTRSLLVRFPDPKALAGELIRRGWLTPYQANQLLQGKGQSLVLGSYILLERLGEGGMGEVFKARHTNLGRVVAIKLIRKERLDNPAAIKRFQREVRAAAALAHPNIVLAYDADEINGTHLLVMEYIEGASDLNRLVKSNGPLPVAQACDLIRQAALGLQHACERGMVHRDIKPHNLLLTADGKTLKILDMGLARLDQHASPDDDKSSTMTQVGAVMGTPDFIAPEQALESHTVDIRADIYSLGCTFYYLLTGKVPFPGGSLAEKLMKHQLREPQPVARLRPDVPPAVASVVRRMMAKKAEDRYQTPAEIAAALASACSKATGIYVKATRDDRKVVEERGAALRDEDTLASAWAYMAKRSDTVALDPLDRELAPMDRRRRWLFTIAGGSLVLVSGVVLLFLLLRVFAEKKPTEKIEGRPAAQLVKGDRKIGEQQLALPAIVDSDRKAAEYVVSIGGKVHVNDVYQEINSAADLPREPFRLTWVDLAANKHVNDASLAQFKHCENLSHLDLQNTQVGDGGLAHLKDCKSLEVLGLTGTKLGDAGLAHFKGFKNLKQLHLGLTKVTDAGLAQFKETKTLTALWLNGMPLSDSGLAHFKDCKNLIEIGVAFTPVTDVGLSHFTDCENLNHLQLAGTKVSNAGLAKFKDCTNLQALLLHDTGVSDAGLAPFKDCKTLTHITLQRTKVTAAQIEELKKALPNCKIEWDGGVIQPNYESDRRAAEYVLSIGGRIHVNDGDRDFNSAAELPREPFRLTWVHLEGNMQVTDAGLAHFKSCGNLVLLNLANTRASNAGLAHFKDCMSLRWLGLTNTQVSNAGLAHFRNCKNLRHLWLHETQVSDAGLAYFKDCKNLALLGLAYTQVTDVGLAHLKDCKKLTSITLQKTNVTAAKIEELKKALPNCKIEWDGGVIQPMVRFEPDRLADSTMPFTRVRRSGKREAFPSLAAALTGLKKDDAIEIHANGPFRVGHVHLRDTALTLRSAPGYRPVLVGADEAAAEADRPWFVLENTAVHIEGCDLRCPPDRTGLRGGGAPWIFRTCRLLGPPNSNTMRDNPGPRLLDYTGPRLRVADCLVSSIDGIAFHLAAGARFDLDNSILHHAANTCIDMESPGGQVLTLENNTVLSHYAPLLASPATPAKEAVAVSVTSARNIFVVIEAPLIRLSLEDVETNSFPNRLRWRASQNHYTLWSSRHGYLDHPKVVSFEAWQKLWGPAETDSRGAGGRYFDILDDVKTMDAQLPYLKRDIDNLKKCHGDKLGLTGPDWDQLGPGTGYVNALKAEGKPVPRDRLAPEKGGPFVVLSRDRIAGGHGRLQDALDAAGDGDTIEIRTDEPVTAGKILSPHTGWRLLTLRGAAGYRPMLKAQLTVEPRNELIVENIHFSQAGIVASKAKEETAGRVSRLANCLWDGAYSPDRLSALCQAGTGKPAEIVNCSIDCRNYPHPVHPVLSPGHTLILRNCHVVGRLQVDTLPGPTAGLLRLERCIFRSPFEGACLLLTGGRTACEVRATVFESGQQFVLGELDGWKGSHNVYRVGHHSWLRRTPAPSAGLNAWRKLWNSAEEGSIEADPIIYDPLQWRVLPDSPAYQAGPGGKDLGADVTRVARTVPAGRK